MTTPASATCPVFDLDAINTQATSVVENASSAIWQVVQTTKDKPKYSVSNHIKLRTWASEQFLQQLTRLQQKTAEKLRVDEEASKYYIDLRRQLADLICLEKIDEKVQKVKKVIELFLKNSQLIPLRPYFDRLHLLVAAWELDLITRKKQLTSASQNVITCWKEEVSGVCQQISEIFFYCNNQATVQHAAEVIPKEIVTIEALEKLLQSDLTTLYKTLKDFIKREQFDERLEILFSLACGKAIESEKYALAKGFAQLYRKVFPKEGKEAFKYTQLYVRGLKQKKWITYLVEQSIFRADELVSEPNWQEMMVWVVKLKKRVQFYQLLPPEKTTS